MKVKIDSNGKICEFNTCECNIDLPQNVMGTHLKSWTYVNGQWSQDPNYVPPTPPADRPGRIPQL
jgi:hypothetical protein